MSANSDIRNVCKKKLYMSTKKQKVYKIANQQSNHHMDHPCHTISKCISFARKFFTFFLLQVTSPKYRAHYMVFSANLSHFLYKFEPAYGWAVKDHKCDLSHTILLSGYLSYKHKMLPKMCYELQHEPKD
jgi:hypothetical protein